MDTHYTRKGIVRLMLVLLLVVALVVPVYSAVGSWSDIGQIATDPDQLDSFNDNGTLYTVTSDYSFVDYSNQLTVKKYDSATQTWSPVGPERFTVGWSQGAFDPKIFVDDGTPYVAFVDEVDYNIGITVVKYTGGSWQIVGEPVIPLGPAGSDNFGDAVSLYVDDGTPYISLIHTVYFGVGDRQKVSVMKYNGSDWIFLGAPRFSDTYAYDAPDIFVADHVPYVAYCEDDPTDTYQILQVKRYDAVAGIWGDVLPIPPEIQTDQGQWPSIIVDGTTIYVSVNDDGYAKVYKYTPLYWSVLGNNPMNDGYASHVSMTLFRGEPYVAIDDTAFGNNNYVTVEKLNASGSWQAVGGNAAPRWPYFIGSDDNTFSLDSDQNALYLSCKFSGYNNYYANVFSYGYEASPTVNLQVSQTAGGSYTNGTVTYTDASKTFPVPVGTGIGLVFTADPGNLINTVTVDGNQVANKPGVTWTYAANNLTSAHSVAVTYAPGYQVTMEIPGGHGTYMGSGLYPVSPSTLTAFYLAVEPASLTAVPENGYALTYWWPSATPLAVSAQDPIPVDAGTAHQFTARFDPVYTYTSSAGTGGAITQTQTVTARWDAPSTDLYYPAVTFTIIPDSGYHILNVMVDGLVQGPVTSYTFPMTLLSASPGNHTISASFEADQNQIDIVQAADDLIAFFEQEVAKGNLTGVGTKGKNDDNRLHAFSNMLAAAQHMIAMGDYEGALLQLESAYAKVDGQPNPPDFVSGASRQALADKILALIDRLEDLV